MVNIIRIKAIRLAGINKTPVKSSLATGLTKSTIMPSKIRTAEFDIRKRVFGYKIIEKLRFTRMINKTTTYMF